MYRQDRRTDEWFAEPAMKSLSGSVTRNLGPGLYDVNPQSNYFQRTQSFNFAKVPFGSSKQRFNHYLNTQQLAMSGFVQLPAQVSQAQ